MNTVVSIKNLNKNYGKEAILKNINLTVNKGEIIGLVGTNGAGKSTLLKSMLGLISSKGEINICGLNPFYKQTELMKTVSFIADTATLPQWLTAKQLLEYMSTMHPNFSISAAQQFLASTHIKMDSKVKKLSKGMVTQLHLALVIAIKSSLLVLDEPTLGLDIIRRKAFYNQLLEHYFDENNAIIITTHQIEEIENILTRAIFIEKGNILADFHMSEFSARFTEVLVKPEYDEKILTFKPIYQEKTLEGNRYILENMDANILADFGITQSPSLTDVFVALSQKSQEIDHV